MGRVPWAMEAHPPLTVSVRLVPPVGVTQPIASAYCEDHWLPLVGPTAYLAARRIARLAVDGQVTVVTAELAHGVGVKPAVLAKALDRLVRFSLAVWLPTEPPTLVVAEAWPVSERLQRRTRVAAVADHGTVTMLPRRHTDVDVDVDAEPTLIGGGHSHPSRTADAVDNVVHWRGS